MHTAILMVLFGWLIVSLFYNKQNLRIQNWDQIVQCAANTDQHEILQFKVWVNLTKLVINMSGNWKHLCIIK